MALDRDFTFDHLGSFVKGTDAWGPLPEILIGVGALGCGCEIFSSFQMILKHSQGCKPLVSTNIGSATHFASSWFRLEIGTHVL